MRALRCDCARVKQVARIKSFFYFLPDTRVFFGVSSFMNIVFEAGLGRGG